MTRLEACAHLGRNRNWVILETGANQAFIFATNKQRVNVGASELVRRSCTDWVDDAIATVIDETSDPSVVSPVVRASGKAILLVPDEQVGRAAVGQVTRRALTEAPGLKLWGTVGPRIDADDFTDAAPTLRIAHQLHASWRSLKRPIRNRHPLLPVLRTCAVGTGPATELVRDPLDERDERGRKFRELAVSAPVATGWKLSSQARGRLRDDLPGADIDQVVPDLSVAGQELGHDGWIAVVHADGNQIDNLFIHLGDAYHGLEFVRTLSDFSAAIDTVTRSALGAAVAAVPRLDRHWLDPLIVGGDDVTFLADARVALRLLRNFQVGFEESSARHPVIVQVTRTIRARQHPDAYEADLVGLTGSAGIASVKPHHPFSDAYELVEQLEISAKSIDQPAGGPPKGTSALDFRVCYESVSTPLQQVRDQLAGVDPNGRPLRLWGGPYRVTAPEAAREPDDLSALRDFARRARAVDLFEVGEGVSTALDPLWSNTQAHALRSAFLIGPGEVAGVRDRIAMLGGAEDRQPRRPWARI